ncbi:cytidylyltransferase domain-containing protein [Polaribacter atrinae]|uniref:acylneuraminate cytidylyltransferase family protein n=1 Tax=Polaribacter atrinae TaxID=1333662 RepID=UPI00248F5C85|nr:acylneuraminate cytidylyltransferase family protein [Polaribacter atrinae]
MRVLGLIPARGGSKGVLGKNIKILGGKPLIQFTSDIALQSNLLTKVIVSTDDDAIIAVAEKIGLTVPFKRPANLANDKSPTLPVILHALEYLESKGECFDAVCLLQVTSPFRSVAFLDQAIHQFIEKDTDSLVSVLEVPHEYNPHWTFELDENQHLKIATGEEEIITRRQNLPKAYHRDGSLYITKTSVLKEQNSLYGKTISHIESPKEFYVNIDTLEDWQKAENIINSGGDKL